MSALIEGKHSANCLVHILVQNSAKFALDYSSFSNPIVLDAAIPFYSLIPQSYELESIYYERFRKVHDSCDYLRSLNCILTLVLVDKVPGSLAPIHYIPLMQRFILPHNSDAEVVLPSYFIIASQSSPFSLEHDVKEEIQGFARKVSNKYFHPIFWLPFEKEIAASGASGWLYCSFCPPSRAYVHFNCPHYWSNCSERMIMAYDLASQGGKSVEWRMLSGAFGIFPQFASERSCPFSLINSKQCVQDEFELVVQHLFKGLNTSGLGESDATPESFDYPAIIRDDQRLNFGPARFIATGQRYEFRFITSHGVAENGVLSVRGLLSPLNKEVWVAFMVTMMTLAFTIGALKEGKMLLITGLGNAHWLFIMCLEQPAMRKIFKGVNYTAAATIMLSCWLAAAVFIVNSYRAMMKCTYILEPSYRTPLKYLRELEGFQLYFIYKFPGYDYVAWAKDRQSHMSKCERQRSVYPQWLHEDLFDCEAAFFSSTCTDPAFYGCGISVCNGLKWLQQRLCMIQDEREWLRRYCKLMRNLFHHARLRRPTQLGQLIITELVKPETAIVVPREELEVIWSQAKVIAANSDVKLASNHDIDSDDLLGAEPYYKISSGFVSTTGSKNIFVFRATMLVESGVCGLWRSWEKQRQSWISRSDAMELPNFMSLSLTNSNVTVVFHLYLYCICGAIVAFAVEFGWEMLQQVWMRRCWRLLCVRRVRD